MTWFAVGAAAVSVVGGLVSSSNAAGAAKDASKEQRKAAQAGIDQQNQQFAKVQELLSPFVNVGTKAVGAQGDLAGLNGPEALKAAVDAIQNGPQFAAMQKQGENALLQNASATGGLRGGNTEAALAEFRPQLLSQLIDAQFTKLGGLTAGGQNAAAGVGTAALNTGNNVSGLLGQAGQAGAGGILGQAQAQNAGVGSVAGGFADLIKSGALNKLFQPTAGTGSDAGINTQLLNSSLTAPF